MRISDWSSDVCSSDLTPLTNLEATPYPRWTRFASRALSRLPSEVRVVCLQALRVRVAVANCLLQRDTWLIAWQLPRNSRCVCLRSEERRVGKGGVSKCRSRWSTYH